jgi:hypothetical protein
MTAQAIYKLVTQYAASLGFANLAPHDLRRTFVKLAHKEVRDLIKSSSRSDIAQFNYGAVFGS